jgi:hypothetical protein
VQGIAKPAGTPRCLLPAGRPPRAPSPPPPPPPGRQVYKESEISDLLSSGYDEAGTKNTRLAPLLDKGKRTLPRDVAGLLRRKGAMVPVASGARGGRGCGGEHLGP